jgi:hypothetical protein
MGRAYRAQTLRAMMALQPLVLRSGQGRLRRMWAVVHRLAIALVRIWVAPLTLRHKVHVYLKGGFGLGQPIYGVSDIDMIIVLAHDPGRPGGRRTAAARRWRRLCAVLPPLIKLFQLWIYEDAELHALQDDTYLTFGLRAGDGRAVAPAAFLGSRPPHDDMRLLDHPGLYGVGRDWRRLGAPRRPLPPVTDPATGTILAWLELRFIWGHAFATAVRPDVASAAYTCQKLVSEPARIWLWLRHAEQLFDREAVLWRALTLLPEEEATLRFAVELGRRLAHAPEPPLFDVLPFLVRMSTRIAEYLAHATRAAGITEVELVWDDEREPLVDPANRRTIAALTDPVGDLRLLPLVDWRACAIPAPLDEALMVVPGEPSDLARVAELARANRVGAYAVLTTGQLLVAPVDAIGERGRLRGIQCATSDPVSHALIRGQAKASFPRVDGWSAESLALRAVAEQRAHLELGGAATALPPWVSAPEAHSVTELSALFSAARAALFADSLKTQRPELLMTGAAVADRLAECRPGARTVVECAYGALAAARLHQQPVDSRAVSALRRIVENMPAFRGADAAVSRRHLARLPQSL